MPFPYPQEWSYREDNATVEEQLKLNACNAVAAIEDYGERWNNIDKLLADLPPQLLEHDDLVIQQHIKNHTPAEKLPPSPISSVLGNGWKYLREELAYSLTVIALRQKRLDLAAGYLVHAEKHARSYALQRELRRLWEQIQGGAA